jgi:peptide/nickel transport system substrate-binding protein
MAGRAASILLGALVAVAACDDGGAIPERARTLVVARARDSESLDPPRAADTESVEVNALLFDTLVRHRADTDETVPWLARAWTVDPSGTTWTFQLRPGVRFTDGTPVDAAAVAWNFERIFDPTHPFHRGAFVATHPGFELTSIAAVDARTVRMVLAAPYAPFLASLSAAPMGIVSPTAAAADERADRAVGSGPYQLAQWQPGERLTLVRNPAYWGPQPSFARLVFEVEPDPRQRLIELEGGAADLARGVRPDELGFVSLHPGLVLQRRPGDNVAYLALHCGRPPFDDLEVRQAISLAIDRAAMAKVAYQGLAVPATSPVPPTQWGHDDEPAVARPDLARARDLLAARAAAGAIDLARTYRLYVSSTPRTYLAEPARLASALRASLEAVGLRVEVVLQPIERHRADTSAGRHDLAVFGWAGELDDPDEYVSLLSSTEIGPDWSRNVAFYRDAVVDRLIERGRREVSRPVRAAIYVELQRRLAAQVPWVPLAHAQSAIVARDDLSGIFLGRGGVVDYASIVRTPR